MMHLPHKSSMGAVVLPHVSRPHDSLGLERRARLHQEKIKNAKKSVDNDKPESYYYLEKRRQQSQNQPKTMGGVSIARCREIEIENEKLLSRMLRMETHIKAHEAPSQSAGSLNFVTRKRDFLRIVKENEALYRRLESLKGRGQMHSTSKLLDEELFAATELSNPSVQDMKRNLHTASAPALHPPRKYSTPISFSCIDEIHDPAREEALRYMLYSWSGLCDVPSPKSKTMAAAAHNNLLNALGVQEHELKSAEVAKAQPITASDSANAQLLREVDNDVNGSPAAAAEPSGKLLLETVVEMSGLLVAVKAYSASGASLRLGGSKRRSGPPGSSFTATDWGAGHNQRHTESLNTPSASGCSWALHYHVNTINAPRRSDWSISVPSQLLQSTMAEFCNLLKSEYRRFLAVALIPFLEINVKEEMGYSEESERKVERKCIHHSTDGELVLNLTSVVSLCQQVHRRRTELEGAARKAAAEVALEKMRKLAGIYHCTPPTASNGASPPSAEALARLSTSKKTLPPLYMSVAAGLSSSPGRQPSRTICKSPTNVVDTVYHLESTKKETKARLETRRQEKVLLKKQEEVQQLQVKQQAKEANTRIQQNRTLQKDGERSMNRARDTHTRVFISTLSSHSAQLPVHVKQDTESASKCVLEGESARPLVLKEDAEDMDSFAHHDDIYGCAEMESVDELFRVSRRKHGSIVEAVAREDGAKVMAEELNGLHSLGSGAKNATPHCLDKSAVKCTTDRNVNSDEEVYASDWERDAMVEPYLCEDPPVADVRGPVPETSYASASPTLVDTSLRAQPEHEQDTVVDESNEFEPELQPEEDARNESSVFEAAEFEKYADDEQESTADASSADRKQHGKQHEYEQHAVDGSNPAGLELEQHEIEQEIAAESNPAEVDRSKYGQDMCAEPIAAAPEQREDEQDTCAESRGADVEQLEDGQGMFAESEAERRQDPQVTSESNSTDLEVEQRRRRESAVHVSSSPAGLEFSDAGYNTAVTDHDHADRLEHANMYTTDEDQTGSAGTIPVAAAAELDEDPAYTDEAFDLDDVNGQDKQTSSTAVGTASLPAKDEASLELPQVDEVAYEASFDV